MDTEAVSEGARPPDGRGDVPHPRAYTSIALALLLGGLVGGLVGLWLGRPLTRVGPLTDASVAVVTSFLGALLVLYPLWLGVGQYLLGRAEESSPGDVRGPLEPYDANVLFLSYLVLFFLVDTTLVVLGTVVPEPVAVSMRLLSLFVLLTGVFVFNRLADVLVGRGVEDPTSGVMGFTVAAVLGYYYVLFWERVPFGVPPRQFALLVGALVGLATARQWVRWYRGRG